MRYIVTCDLDGTLADTRHRHFMIDRENGTDWEAYARACLNDAPIFGVSTLIQLLSDVAEIHYVTGRPSTCAFEAESWIRQQGLPIDGLWCDTTTHATEADYANGYHANYKVAKIREVEEKTGGRVLLHLDDWAEVKEACELAGIPCICVRTPQEVEAILTQKEGLEKLR